MSTRLTVSGLLDAVLLVCGVLVAASTVAAFLAPLHWVLDVWASFPAAWVPAALAALALARRRPGVAVGLFGFALLQLVGLVRAEANTAPSADGPRLRVLLCNVHTENTDHERLAALIRVERPDVVGLLEVDRGWLADLDLGRDYAFQVEEPEEDNFGVALYADRPLGDVATAPIASAPVRTVVARLALGDREVTLVLTHPTPPVSARYAGWRNDQLAALAALPGDVLVLGDLNATPWSAAFSPLRDAGLLDAAVLPSWPAPFPWFLRIPIDHVLVRGVDVAEARLGPDVGSDHLPVIVDVVDR